MSELLASLNEINWVISLLAGIPLAIIANLITPKIENFISKISKKRTWKRISKIKKELEEIESIANHPEKINLETTISIFKVLLVFCLASLFAAIPFIGIVTGPLAALCFLYAVELTSNQLSKFINCRDFVRYKNETEKTIIELEKRVIGKNS